MDDTMKTYFEVVQFLNTEVELLDDHNFQDWLKLLADDIHYVMVRRLNIEADSLVYDTKALLMDENLSSLKARVYKLESEYSWSEIPPSRYRHYVTNIRVKESGPREISVRSNVLFMRNRLDSPNYEFFTYERRDKLRRSDQGLKLFERVIIPDQPVLNLSTLSNFY